MAVFPVVGLAAKSHDLAVITKRQSTIYEGPAPTLIVDKNSSVWNNARAFPAGVRMVCCKYRILSRDYGVGNESSLGRWGDREPQ